MTNEKNEGIDELENIRRCAPLLPDPGPEVVKDLLNRLSALKKALRVAEDALERNKGYSRFNKKEIMYDQTKHEGKIPHVTITDPLKVWSPHDCNKVIWGLSKENENLKEALRVAEEALKFTFLLGNKCDCPNHQRFDKHACPCTLKILEVSDRIAECFTEINRLKGK